MECRISIDQFSIFMKVFVDNKKLRFSSQVGKFQTPVTQSLVQIQPFHFFARINFTSFRNDFLKFYCNSLKWTPKFRSNFCFCIFHSKLQQDLFFVSISDCFKQSTSNTSQIKIIGQTTTKTPRNEKQLKKDGSASSLTSNNKSKQKNNKQKVKISQRLNLKRSCTKLSSNRNDKSQKCERLQKSDKLDNTTRQCLNIFQQEDPLDITSTGQSMIRAAQQPSLILKHSDLEMDLRGSFQQLQQKSVIQSKLDEDKASNHSFSQKGDKNKSYSVQEQNKKLKQENSKLKKQVQSMIQAAKQGASIKKKYLNAVQQLNRLQGQRSAILTDKVKFQSAYYKQLQQKQLIKKQLQGLRVMLGGHRIIRQ